MVEWLLVVHNHERPMFVMLPLEEEGGDGVRRAGEVGRRLRPQLCVGSVGGGPGRVAELEGRQK